MSHFVKQHQQCPLKLLRQKSIEQKRCQERINFHDGACVNKYYEILIAYIRVSNVVQYEVTDILCFPRARL